MTDLIQHVDAVFSESEEPEASRSTGWIPPAATGRGRRGRCTSAGGDVGWFGDPALRHGVRPHARGRATVGMIAALAEVALVICALVRPSRTVFAATSLSNLAVAGFWISLTGGQAARTQRPASGGVVRIAVVVGTMLAVRPELGRTWSSGSTVIASVIPVGVAALAIGGLFATTTARRPRHRDRRPPGRRLGHAGPGRDGQSARRELEDFPEHRRRERHGAVGAEAMGPVGLPRPGDPDPQLAEA